MNLAKAIKGSDCRMSEGEATGFVERALIDGEEITITAGGRIVVAAFKVAAEGDREPLSIVFTSNRLILESEKIEPDRDAGRDRLRGHDSPPGSPVQRRLMSIPYNQIAVHEVVLNASREPDNRNGVLRIWVPGYFRDVKNQSFGVTTAGDPWIDIEGRGKLDLYMLYGILISQIPTESTR